jgi:hypothetical protein
MNSEYDAIRVLSYWSRVYDGMPDTIRLLVVCLFVSNANHLDL